MADFIENNFTKIAGHEDIERQFVGEFNNGKMHHAYLLSGVKGIGKASVALRLAYFLLTQHRVKNMLNPDDIEIDAKDSTYLQMKQGLTPDLMYLGLNSYERYLSKPEDKSDKTIKVEAVKRIESFLMQSASMADYKVVIIDSYEALNKEGSNSILKIVEEPPKKCVFFIITHSDNVLPTIKSRCRKFNFKPLNQEAIESSLSSKLSDDVVKFATKNAGGSIGVAQNLAKEKLYNLYVKIASLLEGADINIGKAQEIGKVIDKDFKADFSLIILLLQQIVHNKTLISNSKKYSDLWFEIGRIGISKAELNLSGEHCFVEIIRRIKAGL